MTDCNGVAIAIHKALEPLGADTRPEDIAYALILKAAQYIAASKSPEHEIELLLELLERQAGINVAIERNA